jgi:hypothetical protein
MASTRLDVLELDTNVYTDRAAGYVTYAHESASQALEAMHTLRAARKKEKGRAAVGRTSDQDQDLLRAMLVFACAGADAATKALIEDALPALADRHPEVQAQVATFTARYVSESGVVTAKQVAHLLSHRVSPREAIIEKFVGDLTGGSLQSPDELQKVRAALGIEDKDLVNRINGLRAAFAARNEIIHELDLNPVTERWARRQRPLAGMVSFANGVFAVTSGLVQAVTHSLGEAADVTD